MTIANRASRRATSRQDFFMCELPTARSPVARAI
jgi:hypothetical protein